MAYTLSRVVLTKTDSGGTSFNFSALRGIEWKLVYPTGERGLGQTAVNFATQMESVALYNVVKESRPDIGRRILGQK